MKRGKQEVKLFIYSELCCTARACLLTMVMASTHGER